MPSDATGHPEALPLHEKYRNKKKTPAAIASGKNIKISAILILT